MKTTRYHIVSIALLCLLATDAVSASGRNGSIGLSRGEQRRGLQDTPTVRGKGSRKCDKSEKTCSPTLQPSANPSPSPTLHPSASPTEKPSSSPSVSPTRSVAPSDAPSDSPTKGPSESPSEAPSSSPTESTAPSVSPSSAPTVQTIEDTVSAEGATTSSCIQSTPKTTGAVLETLSFEFLYALTLNEPDVDEDGANEAVSEIEPKLHSILSREVLNCDWNKDFSVFEVSSGEEDTVGSPCPGFSEEGKSCWEVNAKFGARIFYPGLRRKLASTEVVDAFQEWLLETMPQLVEEESNVDSVEFQGFVGVDLDGKETVETSGAPGESEFAQFIGGNNAVEESATLGWSAAVIGLAGIMLAVLVVGMIVGRRRRQEMYLKHLATVDELDLEPDMKFEIEAKGVIVDDDDLNSVGDYFETIKIEDGNHDYRTCASPSCRLCQNHQQPIFISSDVASVQAEIQEHLGAKKFFPGERFEIDDTQEL